MNLIFAHLCECAPELHLQFGPLKKSAPPGLYETSVEQQTAKRETAMAKYGATAKSKVKKAMHERKKGTLKSGKSGKKVTSRKQAIAIGLSQARRKGGKVPKKKS